MKHINTFIQTSLHKFWVMWYILKACLALIKRAIKHDLSKYSKKEEPYFSRVTHLLKNCEYQSELYNQYLKELKPALDHHYALNEHHPEHYVLGIDGMSDLDRIEMLCDWGASVKRNEKSTLIESIYKNSERFKYGEQRILSFLKDSKEMGL
jgi:hypothetical protein